MKKYNLIKAGLLTTCAFVALSSMTQAQANVKDLSSPYQASNIIHVNTSAEVVQGAQNFIQNVSARGLAFLRDESLNQTQRKNEFANLLRDSFDLRTIGRFALGIQWRQANDEQKKEYLKLFEGMVINTYAKRFEEYQGQEIVVERARAEGKRDAIVNSRIISTNGSPDVRLDWRVRYKDGQYRIIDVLVEGVSMSLTQRSEFSSIIQRGGGNIEALLVKLRER